jgi:exonuclease III
MAEKLKIRSLNVNGIQCQKKRELVFTELSKYSNEIILLQETHSCVLDEGNYRNTWGQNIYFSHGETNSKGVCIIFPKNFTGTSELIYTDLNGRILIVKVSVNKEEYILCNIYCPVSSAETEQLNTLDKLNAELLDYINERLILCGDWNVTMNSQLDKKSEATNLCTNITFREHLKNFITEYEMSDCWRVVHPGKKQYTCRSGKKGKGQPYRELI